MYSYDRTAAQAPNLKKLLKPLVEGHGDKQEADYALESMDDAILDAVGNSVLVKDVLDSLTKVSVSGQDRFEDGTLPSRSYSDSLGFSFTVRYPTDVTVEGTFTVALPRLGPLLMQAAKTEGVLVDKKALDTILRKLDLTGLVAEQLEGFSFIDEYAPPRKLLEKVQDIADSKVDTSIEAYAEGEPNVDLPEYPGVYLKWRFNKGDIKFSTPKGSRGSYQVSAKATWTVKPSHWAFESEARLNDWFRTNL